MRVVEQDGIEAARAVKVMALQVKLGCTDQFLLLALVYAVRGTGEGLVAAQTDFYKDQRLAVAHD